MKTPNRPPSCNQLPTKPGPYYWREKDGDKWKLGNVFEHYDTRFCFETFNIAGKPVIDLQGQWLPVPPAEELVELQACKFELQNIVKANAKEWGMPNDEFMYEFHAWAVNRAKHVLGMHTCEPVTIIKEEKR